MNDVDDPVVESFEAVAFFGGLLAAIWGTVIESDLLIGIGSSLATGSAIAYLAAQRDEKVEEA